MSKKTNDAITNSPTEKSGYQKCSTCPHQCQLTEGQIGSCHARINRNNKIVSLNYGVVSSLALDPIEKKPLRMFNPGSMILSIGSYGCNMHCPFCQNHSISQTQSQFSELEQNTISLAQTITPQELAIRALGMRNKGNIGVAFTYNEPLIGWEFVRDTAKEVRYFKMKNVLVTNGCVLPAVLDEVLPYTDAMNIDLKCFTKEGYKKLDGDLDVVKETIIRAAKVCHVELTTLIVPGLNDNAEQMELEAKWIASIDSHIALHVTRYFPQYKMASGSPTDVSLVYQFAGIAQQYLKNVFVGNC